MTPCASAKEAMAAEATNAVSAVAEVHAFSEGRGTLSWLTVEEKYVSGGTTILLAPSIGERSASGVTDEAVGIRGTLYEDWSPSISTRTTVFLAEDTPVFEHIDVAQDVTFRVADRTAVTAGIRWTEYFEDHESASVSLGVRHYFDGGSIAYRLTDTQIDGGDNFFGHLINLRLNDSEGDGSTQLWLSVGDTAPSQPGDSFSGSNRGFVLQRTQPLWGDVALVAAAGLSSYASPSGRYSAATFRLGLSTKLD